MTILSRYLLRLHLVPFLFSMTACTSIMLLNQVARRLPDLLGKGLPWPVIVEVFALSIPFLVAMTLPMAVLIAVLYSVTRLTADNEITALRAGGVSLGRVMRPLLLAGAVVAGFAFLFSDQVLPRSNHRLRALLQDIGRTKPTFSLDEQVVNEVQRSRFFLRANQIDQATYGLRDVTIYDLTNQTRRRTIYADSGSMAFTAGSDDLYLTLYDGSMHESSRDAPQQFQIMNFQEKIIRVAGVGGGFSRTDNDNFKGDREMGVCEMDSVIVAARKEIETSERRAAGIELNSLRGLVGLAPLPTDSAPPEIESRLYCRTLGAVEDWITLRTAEAREGPAIDPSDETGAGAGAGATQDGEQDSIATAASGRGKVSYAAGISAPRLSSATVLRDRVRSSRMRAASYLVEIHKKYAIAAASFVFVLVGVPVAIAFPRAGVGLVIGVSLTVFSIYYIGLIGGESLGNQLIVSPAVAMWAPNLIFSVLSLFALWHARNRATRSHLSRWMSGIFGSAGLHKHS